MNQHEMDLDWVESPLSVYSKLAPRSGRHVVVCLGVEDTPTEFKRARMRLLKPKDGAREAAKL